MHWTRTSLTILIDFMRKNEILWKITCSDFQKRDLRAALINRSLLINKSSLLFFSHEIPGITEAELNARIRSLKNQYWREKRKQKQSQKSGAGADDLYGVSTCCHSWETVNLPHLRWPIWTAHRSHEMWVFTYVIVVISFLFVPQKSLIYKLLKYTFMPLEYNSIMPDALGRPIGFVYVFRAGQTWVISYIGYLVLGSADNINKQWILRDYGMYYGLILQI